MNNQENQAVEIDVFAMLKTLCFGRSCLCHRSIWLQCLFSQERIPKHQPDLRGQSSKPRQQCLDKL